MIKDIFKVSLIVLLVSTTSPALADVIDLDLELDLQDTSQLEYGQIVPFSLTITNNGPDAAAGSSDAFLPNRLFIRSIFENSNGFPELFIVSDNSFEQECFWTSIIAEPPPIPGAQVSLTYLVNMPIIPANSSITCFGLIQSFIEISNKNITFFSSPILADTDTDLSNNSIDRVFGLRPQIIPTNGILGLIILTLFSLFIGQYYLRYRVQQPLIANLLF